MREEFIVCMACDMWSLNGSKDKIETRLELTKKNSASGTHKYVFEVYQTESGDQW